MTRLLYCKLSLDCKLGLVYNLLWKLDLKIFNLVSFITEVGVDAVKAEIRFAVFYRLEFNSLVNNSSEEFAYIW
jgi:hypothetical protein